MIMRLDAIMTGQGALSLGNPHSFLVQSMLAVNRLPGESLSALLVTDDVGVPYQKAEPTWLPHWPVCTWICRGVS